MINSHVSEASLITGIDSRVFSENFNRRPFKIGHNLAEHDRFSLESLVELSQFLPSESVEYNAGDLPLTQDPHKTPQNGLSVAETIERIENCDSWLVLKNVEQRPAYRDLLTQCLDEIGEHSRRVSPGMSHAQGFIFVSSPKSVTPFHVDPENNFLLQVKGSKTVWMFDQDDRVVLPECQIEDFFDGAHRNIEFREEYRERGQQFHLSPGEALHFPVVAPHYVENGPEVSVSFSVTFQTSCSTDRQSLHRLNRRLRQFGVTPSPVGASAWRDQTKITMLNAIKTARALFLSKGNEHH